jgi:hypothetical protein
MNIPKALSPGLTPEAPDISYDFLSDNLAINFD